MPSRPLVSILVMCSAAMTTSCRAPGCLSWSRAHSAVKPAGEYGAAGITKTGEAVGLKKQVLLTAA